MAKFIYVPKRNIVHSKCDILVNTVNCNGVGKAGVADKFRLAFPDNYAWYQEQCRLKRFKPGCVKLFTAKCGLKKRQIFNVATKDNWRNDSQYKWIEEILDIMAEVLEVLPAQNIALPKLGCGNGNLDWRIVHEMIVRHFKDLDHTFFIYGENPDA